MVSDAHGSSTLARTRVQLFPPSDARENFQPNGRIDGGGS
jgi:hypothetical protein